jgi:cytochrome c553
LKRLAIIPLFVTLAGTIVSEAARDREAFLAKNCSECHDADSQKGKLDLTALKWDAGDPRWIKVFDKINGRKMPPPDAKQQPEAEARAAFLKELRNELHTASLSKQQSDGRVVLRRLNRVEYENTLHDLLGIDLPLQHYLPEDSTTHGFDKVSEGLRLSMLHMGQFLEAADDAIEAAIDLRDPPKPVKRRLRYHDEESVIDDQKKGEGQTKSFRVSPESVVIFDDNSPTALRQFTFRQRGRYRLRISASAVQAAGRPAWLKVYSTNWKVRNLLGYFDLPASGKREIELIANIEAGWLLELKPYDTNYDPEGRALYGKDAYAYQGRGISIDWIDIEGPLPLAGSGRPGLDLSEELGAEKLLLKFATRAFRRPVTAAEVGRYVKLAQSALDEGRSFEDAMRLAYRAVLTSPRFLFFEEKPGKLDDWALASRLSYFLWNTCPDKELRELAANNTLHQPEVLRAQVKRLLDSPKAEAFVENFIGQWLELHQIDFTQPDKKLYPEFDDILKAAMLGETKAFITFLIRSDLPISNLIHSEFVMLNRILAEHYGIPGVTGEEFRLVPVPEGSHRGGVLAHASVLKVTSNGTSTSPVIRGAWVATRLLGEPLPPPPADIPTFEPDTRGATTIREQLAKHRSIATCAACHDRMDPPGFALENFDAIGGWRERYRSEKGAPADRKFRGRRVWEYKLGSPVDSTGQLPDGRKFADIDEFKQLLLEREDQIARNLIQKLLVYATGAGIQFADRATVEKIVSQLESEGGGLRTIIHEIVQSDVFQTK